MGQWEHRIMQYLHRPAQYLWFDMVEWLIFVLPLAFGLLGHSVMFLLLPIFPYWIFPYLRNQRRGFATHLKLTMGFGTLYGYPPPINARFEE